MQFFLPKFFGATPPGTPPKWGPKKSIFLTAQARVLRFFDISRYLTNILTWFGGATPPRGPPKNQFFKRLKVEFYFFLISEDIQQTNILT